MYAHTSLNYFLSDNHSRQQQRHASKVSTGKRGGEYINKSSHSRQRR